MDLVPALKKLSNFSNPMEWPVPAVRELMEGLRGGVSYISSGDPTLEALYE
jgi:hypothetical protein